MLHLFECWPRLMHGSKAMCICGSKCVYIVNMLQAISAQHIGAIVGKQLFRNTYIHSQKKSLLWEWLIKMFLAVKDFHKRFLFYKTIKIHICKFFFLSDYFSACSSFVMYAGQNLYIMRECAVAFECQQSLWLTCLHVYSMTKPEGRQEKGVVMGRESFRTKSKEIP